MASVSYQVFGDGQLPMSLHEQKKIAETYPEVFKQAIYRIQSFVSTLNIDLRRKAVLCKHVLAGRKCERAEHCFFAHRWTTFVAIRLLFNPHFDPKSYSTDPLGPNEEYVSPRRQPIPPWARPCGPSYTPPSNDPRNCISSSHPMGYPQSIPPWMRPYGPPSQPLLPNPQFANPNYGPQMSHSSGSPFTQPPGSPQSNRQECISSPCPLVQPAPRYPAPPFQRSSPVEFFIMESTPVTLPNLHTNNLFAFTADLDTALGNLSLNPSSPNVERLFNGLLNSPTQENATSPLGK